MTGRDLLHLLRFRLGPFLTAFVLWVLISSLPLVTGLLTKGVFDSLSDNTLAGWNAWTFVVVFAVVEVVSQPLWIMWMFAHMSFEDVLMLLMRRNIFHGLLTTARSKRPTDGGALAGGVGDVVSRLRDDVDGAVTPLNEWYRLAGEAMFTVAALVIMTRIDPRVTAVAVIPTGFVVVLLNRARLRLDRYVRAMREAAGRVSQLLGEVFRTSLAVKIHGAEESVVSRIAELGETRRRTAVQATVFNAFIATASERAAEVARAVVLLLVAQSMRDGAFTVGDFALFSVYLEWLFEFPRRVGRLLASRRVARVSTQRLGELGVSSRDLAAHHKLNLAGHPSGPFRLPPRGEPLARVEARGLTFRHESSGRGIEDVSFEISSGGLVVVAGRIGSGKTTLLKTFLGLCAPEAGNVSWNGRIVNDPAHFLAPPRVGYVPQVPHLFSETLRANVVMGLDSSQADVSTAVHDAILDADLGHFADGLDTLLGVGGVRLSGGQVQRTATARALVRTQDLLVVDDVSSALDGVTERALWDAVLGRGLAVLAVSNRPDLLQRADEVIVLVEGRATARGTAQFLLSESREFRDLWTGAAPRSGVAPEPRVEGAP